MAIGAFKLPAGGGGTDISDADAAVTDVVAAKTFYATSGGRKTGTMIDRGTVSTDISAVATEVTIAAGKHSGSGKIKISTAEQAKIIAGNIKKDIIILGVTGTVTSGGLPKTGQTTSYRTGDDGTYQKGFAGTRFTDNGDNTVTDNATGLMWIKDHNAVGSPFNAVMNWNSAIDNSEALNYAGHTDWRLPNVKELFSIVDHSTNNPCINAIFSNTQSNNYFSSTRYVSLTDYYSVVDFYNGPINATNKINSYYVRCVRG